MKEFEFRGKRKDNGEWLKCGSILRLTNSGTDLFFMPKRDDQCVVFEDQYDNIISFDESGIFYAIQPDTIGRGMGRTDSDGSLIYEGDIVQCGKMRFIVSYGDCGGVRNTDHGVGYIGFYFREITTEYWGNRTDPIYYLNAYESRVIGNIYDNPELLLMEVKHEND